MTPSKAKSVATAHGAVMEYHNKCGGYWSASNASTGKRLLWLASELKATTAEKFAINMQRIATA